MWYLILSFFALILYLLESVVSLPFLLIMVIAQASFDQVRPASVMAFGLGLILDVGNSRFLGETAIFFLIVSFFIELYRKRFSEGHLGFLFILSLIISNIYLWLFRGGGILFFLPSILSAVLVIVFTSILYSTWKRIF